jgi:hypothetical protein
MTINPETQTVEGWIFTAQAIVGGVEWELEADFTYTDAGKGHPPYALEDLRQLRGWCDGMSHPVEIHPPDAFVEALKASIKHSDEIEQAEHDSGKDHNEPDGEPRSDIEN